MAVALSVILGVTSCATEIAGEPVSVFDDPFHVAGMDANDGPTGFREDAPLSDREVENSDGGEIDQLSAMTISDVEDYWSEHFSEVSDDDFTPVDNLQSWDATDSSDDFAVCGEVRYGFPNAMYCYRTDTIAWDRGDMMFNRRRVFGDIGLPAVLAHEYGHAIQNHADLVNSSDSVLVEEQQADCFEGAYMRWVAEGNSSRFTLSTGDGLNDVLAELVSSRDEILTEDELEEFADSSGEHGSAFERISAFQMGLIDGPAACVEIDEREVEQRRGDLPVALPADVTGEFEVTDESVELFIGALDLMFEPANPPNLSLDAGEIASCPDAEPTEAAAYCPASNTIAVDVEELAGFGEAAVRRSGSVVTGDNTAYSILTSRYMLAMQHERGVPLGNADAALRTACMTGVSTTMMFDGVTGDDGNTLTLTAGDLDEAVSGLLTNGLAATDVNGEGVPSGFSRIDAFRAGVLGADMEKCYEKFE